MRKTLLYYEQNAENFIRETREVDFSEVQELFLSKLEKGALILDFGCGSGRDTKCFLNRGYFVEAVDGSAEMCRAASRYTGIEVKQMLFHRDEGLLEEENTKHLEDETKSTEENTKENGNKRL